MSVLSRERNPAPGGPFQSGDHTGDRACTRRRTLDRFGARSWCRCSIVRSRAPVALRRTCCIESEESNSSTLDQALVLSHVISRCNCAAMWVGAGVIANKNGRPKAAVPRARGWYGFWYGLGTVSARIGPLPCRPDPGNIVEITTFSRYRPCAPSEWGSGGRRFESGRPDHGLTTLRLWGLFVGP